MTTIIMTIIGILLAAAASLMIIFYGGDAFNSGSVGARAVTIQNAGNSVQAAVNQYRSVNGKTPATWEDLTGNNTSGRAALSQIPEITGIPSESQTFASGQYLVKSLTQDVCNRINSDLRLARTPTMLGDREFISGCIPSGNKSVYFFYT